jgi:hypothetical protein
MTRVISESTSDRETRLGTDQRAGALRRILVVGALFQSACPGASG